MSNKKPPNELLVTKLITNFSVHVLKSMDCVENVNSLTPANNDVRIAITKIL
jgi:hypothetical protein